MTVRVDEQDGQVALALKFKVEAADIDGAYLYEAAKDAAGKDIYTDTEFAYTGEALDIRVAADGKPLDADYYTVSYFKKGTNKAIDVVDAGSYVAEIKGREGSDYEGYEEQISFDVSVVDLADAAVELKDGLAYCIANPNNTMALDFAATAAVESVDEIDTFVDELNLKFVSASNGKTANLKSEPGTYTYELYAPADAEGKANPNITGKSTVTFVRYEKEATFEYNDAAFGNVNFKDFDEAEIEVTDDKGNDLDYTVKYFKSGKEVTQITGYGTYEVVVTVDSAAEAYKWGGQDVLTVDVTPVEIDLDKNAFIKFAGEVVNVDQKEFYNGSDFAKLVEVLVLNDKNKALTAGVDYDVVITDADGDVVTEMVNWGEYTITIKENADSVYKLKNDKDIKLTVEKAPVTARELDQLPELSANALFTGEEIDPIADWLAEYDINEDGETDEKDVIEVPSNVYKVKITAFKAEGAEKWADPEDIPTTFVAAGEYKYDIVDADAKDNYVVDADLEDLDFVITAKNVFADVASSAWYADEVYSIAVDGIMGGYGNGLFGPNNTAERQDLAVTLFRLLDEDARLDSGQDWEEIIVSYMGELNEEIYLPFSDTNGKAYYALAVWYCNKNGIMTGYSDSDEFGVGDAVTREQVATTLFRIANAGLYNPEGTLIDDVNALASALDAYADADEVSKYAVEAMEWAVENGIFGVDTAYLNPGDEITRAELAAVIVRYMALEA